MFSRVRNPFLIFLLSYHVSVTSKIQVNFRYRRYLKVLMIVSYKFLKFLHYLCFRGQRIHFWYSLATMFGWPRKSSQLPVQEVLMILSYEFLKFLHYLCFRGRGIHCWHSYWATMFGWPRKSRSTSGTGGTWRYWWLCLIEFLTFLDYLCFWGQGIHCRHFYRANMFGWPRKSRSTSGFWWFWDSLCFRGNPLLTFLLSYLVWVTSKTSRTGSWPRFSRSPKRGSSVGISAMDFDLENINSREISKIHKTESSVPPEPEVDLDFRGHPNM